MLPQRDKTPHTQTSYWYHLYFWHERDAAISQVRARCRFRPAL